MEHGDERREDLHAELKIRAQRGHIVHYAQNNDDGRAQQNALQLMVDLDKQQHAHDKAEENREAAEARYGLFVHAAVVLRHVDRGDLIGKRLDERAHQKADGKRAQQRAADAQQ